MPLSLYYWTSTNLFFLGVFNQVTSHACIRAGIDSTINGSNFADAIKASLFTNIQGEVGQFAASWIESEGAQ